MELTPIKRTNLLILRGVFPHEFSHIDNIYDKTPIQAAKITAEPVVVYTEMPKKFTGVENWPKFSNLKCWECDLMPEGPPAFIPVCPEKGSNGEDICDARGHFHTWNCAVRYIEREYPETQRWDYLQSISLFESKFSGRRREKIMPAPPKSKMKSYCGNKGITPKQFNDEIAKLNENYDLSSFKLEHFKGIE